MGRGGADPSRLLGVGEWDLPGCQRSGLCWGGEGRIPPAPWVWESGTYPGVRDLACDGAGRGGSLPPPGCGRVGPTRVSEIWPVMGRGGADPSRLLGVGEWDLPGCQRSGL